MERLKPMERGRRIACLLAGAWRSNVPPLACSWADLRPIVPLAIRGGAAGLAWHKIAIRPPADDGEVEALRNAARQTRLGSFLMTSRLIELSKRLDSARIDAVLSKGWSVARFYPESGIRTLGDIDLHVPKEQFERLRSALEESEHLSSLVDLHHNYPDLGNATLEEMQPFTRSLALGDVSLRILADEELLRLVCLHFARHGGFRPLWLCDVATIVESVPGSFDWDRCLGNSAFGGDWVRAVVGLAGRLLHARVPMEIDPGPTHWLDRVVLAEWGQTEAGDSHSRDPLPMSAHLRSPRSLGAAVLKRLPNAMEAAIKTGRGPARPGRFNSTWTYALRRLRRWLRPRTAFAGLNIHRDD